MAREYKIKFKYLLARCCLSSDCPVFGHFDRIKDLFQRMGPDTTVV